MPEKIVLAHVIGDGGDAAIWSRDVVLFLEVEGDAMLKHGWTAVSKAGVPACMVGLDRETWDSLVDGYLRSHGFRRSLLNPPLKG